MNPMRRIPRPAFLARRARSGAARRNPAHRVMLAVSFIAAAAAAACWFGRPGGAGPVLPSNWALDPATRINDWQEDIDALTTELPRRHKNAFFKCSRGEFEAAAARLRGAVPDLGDHEVVVGLMKLAAMIGDAHTGISAGELTPAFHSFPLRLYVFADGPVIVAARGSQIDLVGCSLVSFGGVPAEEAFRRVTAGAAYENEATFTDLAPRLLCIAELAQTAGLIPTTERATIVVRDAQGHERAAELTPLAAGEKLTATAPAGASLPLARQARPHKNWFQVLPEDRALYFRYDTCADEPGQTVAQLSGEALAAIDSGGVERVVVDLRGNGGGNSGLLARFVDGLRRRPAVNHPGGMLVLIGRSTFSSAHMHAVDMKATLGATLIGEPTGQKPNAYGEVRRFVLPHSRISVRYSTRFWRTEPGDRPSLEPDIAVAATSADYFSLRDPALEAALAQGRGPGA